MSDELGERRDLPRILRRQLEKYEQTADRRFASLAGEIDRSSPTEIVYHYTNDIGLKGILESGKIWLTDIFDLNDPSELTYGISYAVEHLEKKTHSSSRAAQFFSKVFTELRDSGIKEVASYFTCSFSSDGDDLGQWRAYADNGRGYALGFTPKAITDALDADADHATSSFFVQYDDDRLRQEQKILVDLMLPLLDHALTSNYPRKIQAVFFSELGTIISMNALTVALLFKHKAYRHELEYRLLKMKSAGEPTPGVRLRTHRYSLGRYLELDWRSHDRSALKNIVLGPAADQAKAEQFARQCITSFNAAPASIIQSKIPYRAT